VFAAFALLGFCPRARSLSSARTIETASIHLRPLVPTGFHGRTHLVHVIEFLGEEWCGNLLLRNAIRRDASLRGTYLQVKE
jgi:hypothetical protein